MDILGTMTKVLQIRGLSSETHDALARAAAAEGLSLTRYVRRELDALASRAELARRNSDIVWATKKAVGTTVRRALIQEALATDRRE